ncbi:hypothetical protein [Hymenobacter yonginensis]|uniref:Uncharacterized protein n=1 Tax=Hymenobacter yonginensis TaxID=748197 RepID=A0ABY7PSU5_9BACT|nr:hypothetical protein [Hymenobacter yonginensis]WBO85980.1 hypothetical protein O9Z63_06935 [Hymenobacter yonginensis]
MRRRFLSLLLVLAPLSAALAQTPSEVLAASATPFHYGVAYINPSGTLSNCKLILIDGVTPNPKLKNYEEDGRDKIFVDQAAVLNFLAAQGWEIMPTGGEGHRYLLKRPRR